MEKRRGRQTSEFWTTIGATILTAGIAFLHSPGMTELISLAVPGYAIFAPGLINALYVWSRTEIKKKELDKEHNNGILPEELRDEHQPSISTENQEDIHKAVGERYFIVNELCYHYDVQTPKKSGKKIENSKSKLGKIRETLSHLSQLEIDLQKFFDISVDLFCISTPTHFIKVNKAWEHATGYKVHEIEGQEWRNWIHPDDLEKTNDAAIRMMSDELILFSNRLRSKDKGWIHIQWNSTPYNKYNKYNDYKAYSVGRVTSSNAWSVFCEECPSREKLIDELKHQNSENKNGE